MATNGAMQNGHEQPRGLGGEQPQGSGGENPQGLGSGPQVQSTTDATEVICGPLINYRRMSGENTGAPRWHGSILLVVSPGNQPRPLRLTCAGFIGENGQINGEAPLQDRTFQAVRLFEDPNKGFWRYEIDVPLQEEEAQWRYDIPNLCAATVMFKNEWDKPKHFSVPSMHESMRIMFHSCNGFSVGTDEDYWSGPALWNDVLRMHEQKPFHVMIGGGDQIYNDGVRVDGPLKPWTAIGDPIKRQQYPFEAEMRAKCDLYYFENYVKWYGMKPFSTANGMIPQLNIWDDHDIIDGFGSYTDHFMKCAVFRGIGGVAHKYYMLFQHHVPPPITTFTTAPKTTDLTAAPGTPVDPAQIENTFVMTPTEEDPSYILGDKPGPYVEEVSRNVYCQLGKRIAFAGIDARTERTRHQVNYPATYDKLFNHITSQIAASNGEIKHFILLLGVPIAYPRLQWLENILQSPIIGPIRFLNKRFGVAGSLFNQFDGKPDLLDDLDDHYTARQHKKERRLLIQRLQALGKAYNVRVTILGGDVHLAALGRFYSNPDLKIPAEQDHRYIPNIVSSAITNKPPPQPVANLLAKRNKIHHLDHDTDETLLELFDKQPGHGEEGFEPKAASNNHATMPSRNYAIISESNSRFHPVAQQPNGNSNGESTDSSTTPAPTDFQLPKNPREPLHVGEKGAGIDHPAAQGITPTGLAGVDGLDVTIRVEKNSGDPKGTTQGYGFCVPALTTTGASRGSKR